MRLAALRGLEVSEIRCQNQIYRSMNARKLQTLFGAAALISSFTSLSCAAAPTPTPAGVASVPTSVPTPVASSICETWIQKLPEGVSKEKVAALCAKAQGLPSCQSEKGEKIFHFDRLGTETDPKKHKRILVFGLIHGDEFESGALARDWAMRVTELPKVRNTWRVVPILNPDGLVLKTRTNGNGIDLNRNFPTADWNETAQVYWKKSAASNPRRFPGKIAGSEKEVHCAIDQIKDFKADLIVSIHTPYHVIDMDGPTKASFPKFPSIPFQRLGHFPGSLGRYMWRDHHVPVVTVELGDRTKKKLSKSEEDLLQDIMGDVAIRVNAGED